MAVKGARDPDWGQVLSDHSSVFSHLPHPHDLAAVIRPGSLRENWSELRRK